MESALSVALTKQYSWWNSISNVRKKLFIFGRLIDLKLSNFIIFNILQSKSPRVRFLMECKVQKIKFGKGVFYSVYERKWAAKFQGLTLIFMF